MRGQFDTRHCHPGQIVELADGARFQVSENPGDGVWMFGRKLGADGALGPETTIYVDDITGIVGAPGP